MFRNVLRTSGSHAGTVVPECYKDDVEGQWKTWNSTPAIRKPLNWWLLKLAGVTTSRISTPVQNWGIMPPTYAKLPTKCSLASLIFGGSSNLLPPRPMRRFWRSIRQKTSFHATICFLGVPKTNFYILTLFLPIKTQIFGRFSTVQNFGLKRALTWGTSSVNTL